jgi:Ca2+-binding RTX toxin-like protein
MRGAAGNGVSQMQFADGTVWSASQMTFDATNGTTGADTIVGTAGNDVIDGRGGGDTVYGNGGDDTYIFRLGYGSLQIINSTPTGASPSGQLDFGTGLTENNLWFVQNGNDLDVDILNSQDQIVIDGWFGATPSASLAEFVSGDGLKLDGAFAQLLSAMAVYQANNPGFDPNTAGSMPTDSALRNAISTAWHS